MFGCNHKTILDHTRVVDGVTLWTCSCCKREAPWGDTWVYWGSYECKSCCGAEVYSVACSEACAALLGIRGAKEKKKAEIRSKELKPSVF